MGLNMASMRGGYLWQTAILYTDGGKDFRSNHSAADWGAIRFVCHLRDRPSEGGIVELERSTQSCFQPYLIYRVKCTETPGRREQEACLTLRQLEQQLVRYIVDNHNQRN